MKYTSGQKIKMTGFRWERYRGHKVPRVYRESVALKASKENRGRRAHRENLAQRETQVQPGPRDRRVRMVNRARMEDITRLPWMPKEILALLAANLECRRSLEQISEARRDRPGLMAHRGLPARKGIPVRTPLLMV